WEALKQRLAPVSSVSMQQSPGRVVSFRRWAAAAAVLVLLASGIIWYITAGNREQLYVTAANEQKEISLPDGSTIALKPFTEIHVAGDYNQRARSIQLVKGEAFFNVVHNASKPFTVNMDESSVKDLGTSFTIRRSADTVKVMVT
ncbi:FecR domain-containing protein, partial|uniref:FecR family protein n=1 Tax=Escherichia coli TaxID=562 RepID=UPI00144449D2